GADAGDCRREDRDVLALNRQALSRMKCETRLEIVPGASHLFSRSWCAGSCGASYGKLVCDASGGWASVVDRRSVRPRPDSMGRTANETTRDCTRRVAGVF